MRFGMVGRMGQLGSRDEVVRFGDRSTEGVIIDLVAGKIARW